jgi:hypothetical protein
MSSELTVVVEERADALVMRRLISRALNVTPTFYSCRGRVSPATMARNILVHEGGPVLVVMDTHTTHSDSVDEALGMTRLAVELASHRSAFHVHPFVPELDVIFYEATCVLQRHFGRPIVEMELELGRLDSRRQLDRVLADAGVDRDAFFCALDDKDLDHLLSGEQMKALIAGADELLSGYGAATAC